MTERRLAQTFPFRSARGEHVQEENADPKGLRQPMTPLQLLPYQQRWVEDDSPLKIAVKARQIGYSFAATLRAVLRCLERRTTWIFLSKGERQSRLLMEKVQSHVQACGIVAQSQESTFFEGTQFKQLEVRLPNGSVIYGLPANPDTARGYTGNVTLDEFAFHADAEKIYAALFPAITRGFSLEIISTPNGQRGKFYELAKAAGLAEAENRSSKIEDRGSGRASSFDSRVSPRWSGHWCDIYEAIRQGLKINLETLRRGCDEPTWQQEFCCQFVSTAAQWISPELWQMNVSSEATVDPRRSLPSWVPAFAGTTHGGGDDSHSRIGGNPGLFAGWDIARTRDLSVIWVIEQVGDVSWTRGVIALRNMPTPDQVREARALLCSGELCSPTAAQTAALSSGGDPFLRQDRLRSPLQIHRMAIDQSGMGLAIFEQLQREFPARVEGVQFTQATKEAMAVRVKDRMEKRLLRLPDNEEIRQSFMSLKRAVTATGLSRFDAEHDARYGHADHFWACALAEAAAEREGQSGWQEGFLADAAPVINPRAFEVAANWAGIV